MVDLNLLSSAVSAGSSYLPEEAQAALQSLLPQSPQSPLPVTPVVPLAVVQGGQAPVMVAAPKSKMGLYIGIAAIAVGAFFLYKKFKKSGKK